MRRLFLAALSVPLAQMAVAGERPGPDDMGKLLAYTVNCTCVVGDRDWILDIYRQIFAESYGEAYANALQAPLQGALSDGWDRHMGLCERICDLPVTRELQLALARADGGAVDGSGVRAVLGPPPEKEAEFVYVAPAGGDAESSAAGSGEQGTAVAVVTEEEAVIVVTPPEAESVAVMPAATAEPGSVPGENVGEKAFPVAAEEAPPAAEILAEAEDEREGGQTRPDYFEEAGTGDNWSSMLCRTSPSRPECRKAGGS